MDSSYRRIRKIRELAQPSVYVSIERAPRGKNVLYFFSFSHASPFPTEREKESIALRPGENQFVLSGGRDICWEGMTEYLQKWDGAESIGIDHKGGVRVFSIV